MTSDFHIVPAGDASFVIEFANRLDVRINERIVALWRRLEQAHVPGVLDLVPAYRTLGVYFDPLRTDVDRLLTFLQVSASASETPVGAVPDAPIRVAVRYGGEHGPDLEAVAAMAGLLEDEVIAIHAAPIYRVFMVGFAPGFAYMGPVDTRIAAPRRATPRLKVLAGSVGIAGPQTGIYPLESPGGWMIVGRTPIRPFAPNRTPAFLFKAGDLVQFEAIGADEYTRLSAVEEGRT